jgi:hypothetical protein
MRRLLVVGLLVLASCGGSSDIEPRASRDLTSRMTMVRSAVDAGDRVAARAAVRDLERAVTRWQAQDLVSDARAEEILAAAEEVLAQLSLLPPPSPSPTMTSPSPTPSTPSPPPTHAPKPPHEPPGHEPGHGHGNDDEGHGQE